MNLGNKFQKALDGFKSLEEQYAEKIKCGDRIPLNFHFMSYYSGVVTGFKFVWHILDNHCSEKEFDELFNEIISGQNEPN